MKTTYKFFIGILLIALVIPGVTSCSDFLEEDPKGQLATKNFFTNKNDLEAAWNALYSVVCYSHRTNGHYVQNGTAGDDVSTHPASNKQALREHDQYAVYSNNPWMYRMWQRRYQVIKAANFVINNAARTPGVSEAAIKELVANAHYWRAFEYFTIVMTWGKAPIMLEEEVNYEAELASEQQIYDLIVSDLKIAEAGVPINYTKEPYTINGVNIAVSQAAVKASLSYVYMCMAGWPLNKGTEYYKLAAAKAKEVIDGVDNGTYNYALLDDYHKVYSKEWHRKNPELLLGIYFNLDSKDIFSPTPADYLLDQKQGGWGDTNGEIKFWVNFPDGPRKDATYFPKIMLQDGVLRDWWYDTDPPSRPVVAPPFMKTVEGVKQGDEFDYTNPTTLPSAGEKTQQTIRLSQVYCWYAEATGRSGQVNAQAVNVLNKVRNRADGKETNLYSTSMTPEELAEAAYDEHGWEMAGYYWSGFAFRARDMFRMYRYKDHFEFRKRNPMIEVAPGIFRNEAVPVEGEWNDSRMYCAYPSGDAILNPNLKN
ncbi:MAG: RagB/SusD family nutrient uptake outer membrane protein [Fermentimonas sp.]